jgi:hypothetical protein
MLTLSQFSVIDPAVDLSLLTPEELRAAAGLPVGDTSQDDALAVYGEQVAAEIASDCAITADGINPPTLRSEHVRDVYRLDYPEKDLLLSRKHVSDVTSVTENGIILETTDWRLNAETGKLVRLVNDADACWSARKIEVEYTAGFDVIPAELKAEATSRLYVKYSAGSGTRDPAVRSIRVEIPGVETRQTDYQVSDLARSSGSDDLLPPDSERRLRRFMMQPWVG